MGETTHHSVTWDEGTPHAATVCFACGLAWPCPHELLRRFLWRSHPDYGPGDVALSHVPGYLHCTMPCPRAGQHWYCDSREHYHTISIAGEGYPRRDADGRFVSPYRLWRELHGLLAFTDRAEEGRPPAGV